jgi:hypothetical protein
MNEVTGGAPGTMPASQQGHEKSVENGGASDHEAGAQPSRIARN